MQHVKVKEKWAPCQTGRSFLGNKSSTKFSSTKFSSTKYSSTDCGSFSVCNAYAHELEPEVLWFTFKVPLSWVSDPWNSGHLSRAASSLRILSHNDRMCFGSFGVQVPFCACSVKRVVSPSNKEFIFWPCVTGCFWSIEYWLFTFVTFFIFILLVL